MNLLRERGPRDHGIDPDLRPGSPHDDDFQLALWMLNTVQVAEFEGVDDHRAGSLCVQNLRWLLQRTFEDTLRELVPPPRECPLTALIDELRLDGPTAPASRTTELERLVAKTPYLAWEADPHTLALARVERVLKPSLAAIQAGEYGVGFGDPHAAIFRKSLDAVGIGVEAALERASAESYAFANAAWLFGSDRRLRGAALGQLCLLEMDSVEPCARAVKAWDELGLPEAGRRWYDVHVLADEEHDKIIREQLISTLESETPYLVGEAAWGSMVTHELGSLMDRAVTDRASSQSHRV